MVISITYFPTTSLSVRITPHLFLSTQIQSIPHLFFMHLIQVLQQHIPIPFLALILTHIVAPTSYCACQSSRDIRLFADLGDGMEVGSYSEDYAASLWESVGTSSVSRPIDRSRILNSVLSRSAVQLRKAMINVPSQTLPLTSKPMMFNRFILFRLSLSLAQTHPRNINTLVSCNQPQLIEQRCSHLQ
jgi:hypothetical protein